MTAPSAGWRGQLFSYLFVRVVTFDLIPLIMFVSPKPEQWGAPIARFEFSNTSCPAQFFGPQRIVINLTFCGSWGEAVWEKGDAGKGVMDSTGSQCFEEAGGTTCDAFVRGNPEAFRDAFWQIGYVRVYQREAPDK